MIYCPRYNKENRLDDEIKRVKVGIIDYDEINECVSFTRKKWVAGFSVGREASLDVVCKLEMGGRGLVAKIAQLRERRIQ